ncbi:MAG: single-stranded DNA-binding protein [Chloroflexi bacterium]|nr:single-stranded DNA-binding protein [Chloroflexota bacterium]
MYQQITIIGNVGRDPDLRFTPQGIAVCDFSVAVNKRVGGQNNTEPRDETTWFRVTCWRQLAETVAKYVKKGKQIMVVGEVTASAYTDKNQQPAATLEITAQTVKFLGSRDDSEGGGEGGGGQRYQDDFRPPQQESSGGKSGGQRGGGQRGGRNQAPPENSDDIPF